MSFDNQPKALTLFQTSLESRLAVLIALSSAGPFFCFSSAVMNCYYLNLIHCWNLAKAYRKGISRLFSYSYTSSYAEFRLEPSVPPIILTWFLHMIFLIYVEYLNQDMTWLLRTKCLLKILVAWQIRFQIQKKKQKNFTFSLLYFMFWKNL